MNSHVERNRWTLNCLVKVVQLSRLSLLLVLLHQLRLLCISYLNSSLQNNHFWSNRSFLMFNSYSTWIIFLKEKYIYILNWEIYFNLNKELSWEINFKSLSTYVMKDQTNYWDLIKFRYCNFIKLLKTCC